MKKIEIPATTEAFIRQSLPDALVSSTGNRLLALLVEMQKTINVLVDRELAETPTTTTVAPV